MTTVPILKTSRHDFSKLLQILLLAAGAMMLLNAQTKETKGPDTIVFANGEKLSGHFVKSTGSSVTFKSDALGEITIDWSKVKELETTAKVAVIRKGVMLRRKAIPSDVPQGTLAMQDQKLQITPAPGTPPQSIPVGDSAQILDQAAFQKAITRTPGFFTDWTGNITLGASLVQGTQDNRTATGALNLVRAEPTESWLNPSSKTSIILVESYGELSQPSTPTIRTSITHGAAEQDKYFTPSVFAFGQADFDHNFSQGLDLQQTYSGGIGWTAIKSATQELDVKAGASYIRQQFLSGSNGVPTPTRSLVGSVFGEHYHRKLARGASLDQNLTFTPAWNDTSAYSALFNTLLAMPVFKRLSVSASVSDTFLNDPPEGFKKNSFQFTLGITYAFK